MLIEMKLSRNNSKALKSFLKCLSEMEKRKEVVSIIILTRSDAEEGRGGVFNVETVASNIIPPEITEAMGDSIFITLKHFSGGKGEIVHGT